MAFETRNWKLENRKGVAPGNGEQFRFANFQFRSSEAGSRQSTIANKSLFLWLWPGAGLCLAVLVVLGFSCCSSLRQGSDVPLTELHGGLDPLRKAFNKDVGKVRLMLLLDPT